MSETPRLGLWWPLGLGVTIGVEATLTALILFGAVPVKDPTQLTTRGLGNFHPERDVAIYAAGCVGVALLVAGFSRLWQRRFARMLVANRDGFICSGCDQLLIAGAVFLLHFGWLLVVRRWFAVENTTPPALPIAVLVTLPIASLMLAVAAPPRGLRVAPRWFARSLGAVSTMPETPTGSFDWRLDIAMPILLCAVIYIPAWRNLAGQVFLLEGFHHWDFFAMGPTLAFHHGKPLGTDAYTQYSVAWPMLFSALSGLVPITYGRFIQIAVICGCVYFIGVYVLLRLTSNRAPWAAAGVIVALSLQLFHGLFPDEVMWRWPSSTVMRSVVDVWFFVALVLHLRTKHARWAAIAGAFVGLALLCEIDTGLYLAIAFVAYWVFALGIVNETRARLRARVLPMFYGCASALLVLLLGLSVASRGTITTREFWIGWSEPLLSYGAGLGMLPIASVSDGALVLFTVVISVLLGATAFAILKLLRCESDPSDVLLGCLASYGLLVLIIFVGRSHPFNIFHASVPFSLVVTILAARVHQRIASFGGARRKTETERTYWSFFDTLMPWCALIGAVIWLIATPAFQGYPGMLKAVVSGSPPEGLCLLRDPPDACGLPPTTERYVLQFNAAIDALREHIAAGKTVAVLDDTDSMFYLAADATPWWRYSPSFPAIARRSELAALQEAIASHGPQFVMVRADASMARWFNEEDVWSAVQGTIKQYYSLDRGIGVYQIWRRKEKRQLPSETMLQGMDQLAVSGDDSAAATLRQRHPRP